MPHLEPSCRVAAHKDGRGGLRAELEGLKPGALAKRAKAAGIDAGKSELGKTLSDGGIVAHASTTRSPPSSLKSAHTRTWSRGAFGRSRAAERG